MDLSILVRGQSNAILMMEANHFSGSGTLAGTVERLLGFDGTNDHVNILYSRDSPNGNTAFGASAFLGDWMVQAPDGTWQAGPDETDFLTFIAGQPKSQAPSTAILWMHSEYDSRDDSLQPATWTSAVRADATLVRQALGGTATSIPYYFVSAFPFGGGGDTGHQAIRIGMEQLASDPNFNGHIAARALDVDASLDERDANFGTLDFGGPHLTPDDTGLIAERAAFSIAEGWAAFAKPGSPLALASGDIDNLGPEIVSATPNAPDSLVVKAVHDHSAGFAPLDPDAATGIGWSVRANGASVSADSVTVLSPDTLQIHFSGALPAGGALFYGYGYGRLAAPDQPGQGNAVYDQNGLPIWTPAEGVPVTSGGIPAAEPPLNLPPESLIYWHGQDGSVALWALEGGQVTGSSIVANPGTFWTPASTGDYNGDARTDILFRGQDGSVVIWDMAGSQILNAGNVPNPGRFWSVADTGDFDHDGRSDILWHGQDGSVAVWTMDGTQVKGGGIVADPGNFWNIAATGDFNSDGRTDILFRGQDGSVATWIMDGSHVAGAVGIANPGAFWTLAGTGDFDGDSSSDILWRGQDGSVAIWIMRGGQVVDGSIVANPGNFWNIAATGDYNGDSRTDILFRGQDGSVALWTMDGTQVSGGGPIASTSHDWNIIT